MTLTEPILRDTIREEEALLTGFVSPQEITRRLERHFQRSLAEPTLLELACQLEIAPEPLAATLKRSRWRHRVRW